MCFFLISNSLEVKNFDEVFVQLDPSGDKFKAMGNTGDNTFFEAVTSMIIGYDRVSRISQIGTISESALIVLLYEMGLFTFALYFLFLLFPIYIFYKSSKILKYLMWPYLITYFSGLTTLVHYGSLFRSTSIFMFFLFYGRIFQIYLHKNKG